VLKAHEEFGMNPFWILWVVVMVVLFTIGSINGRKQQEWKNLLRIFIGVGLFVVGWRAIIASNLDQWTKVGIIVFACLALWVLNMVKAFSPRR
jgi:Na+/phosphate symporter